MNKGAFVQRGAGPSGALMNVHFSPLRHRASLCTFTAPLEENGGMGGVGIGRMETGWGFQAASEIIGTLHAYVCQCVCLFLPVAGM